MSYSAAAAASSTTPLSHPYPSFSSDCTQTLTSALSKKGWSVTVRDSDNTEVPFDVFLEAIAQETRPNLTSFAQRSFDNFESNLLKDSFNTYLEEFIGKGATVPGGDKPLFIADCDPAVILGYAHTFFGYGTTPNQLENWINCFAEDALYISGNTYYYGKDLPQKLRAEIAQAPKMDYDGSALFVRGNMTYARVRNRLHDGRVFSLVSINYFDPVTGKVIFNADVYDKTAAATKVLVDLATVPSDAVAVLEQQRRAALAKLKAEYKALKGLL